MPHADISGELRRTALGWMSLATTAVLVIVCAVCGGLWIAALISGLARGAVREVVLGAAWSVCCLSAVAALAAAQWLPTSSDKPTALTCGGIATPVSTALVCPPGAGPLRYHYCEAFHSKQLRQPLNTASDLAFVASGMWIFRAIGIDRRRRASSRRLARVSPMARSSPESIAYAMIVVLMGPASMLLHASMKVWAGYIDAMSVIAWAAFGICYTGSRLIDAKAWAFWPMWAGAVALAAVPSYLDATGATTTAFQVAYGLGFFLVEVTYQAKTQRRSWPYLGAITAVLGCSLALWAVSGAVGFQLCTAESAFQGHMVFHLGAAAATFLVFLNYRLEREASARSRAPSAEPAGVPSALT